MSRRASSKVHPGLIIGIVAVVGLLIFVGQKFIGHKQSTGFGNVPKLIMDDYLQNANSLRGSKYVVEGKVEEKLRWTAGEGQVISLLVTNDGKGAVVGPDGTTPGQLIGIKIPAQFNDLNIDRNQNFAFRVEFGQGGIPVATGINRL